MILVQSLLYKIDQRLNKLSSNAHQEIQLEDKILALNEAQIKLVKQKLSLNNNYKLGLDSFKKRYEDLENLIEEPEDHSLTLVEANTKLNKWVVDTIGISPSYMFYIWSYFTADKEECRKRIINVEHIAKHADVPVLLNNTNYKPSFEYQATFGTLSENEVAIYTDGTFTPRNLYLSYLRYPQEIDSEGYVKFDGSDSIITNSELEAYLEDELLDLTVQNLAMYTENISAVQSASLRIQTNE